jgi:rubrerythrin
MDGKIATQEPTVERLLEVAVELEEHARQVYDGLAERFAHVPEVAKFWRQYAAAEANHRKALEQLRASLPRGKAGQLVDASLLQSGQRLLAVSVEELLKPITDLDDAYELANELEASETNKVFEFLVRELASDPRVLEFLSADLQEHVEHIWKEFPSPYTNRENRRRVRVLKR